MQKTVKSFILTEMDIVMKYHNKIIAIECKATLSPSLSRGNHNAIADINPYTTFVVAPVKKGWPLKPEIDIVSLTELILQLKKL